MGGWGAGGLGSEQQPVLEHAGLLHIPGSSWGGGTFSPVSEARDLITLLSFWSYDVLNSDLIGLLFFLPEEIVPS